MCWPVQRCRSTTLHQYAEPHQGISSAERTLIVLSPRIAHAGCQDLNFEVLDTHKVARPADDAWMGITLVDGAKGKARAASKLAHCLIAQCSRCAGRKNLFEVLDMHHPARPGDDAWMGNMLVNPAKGKAHAAGPEERMGRKNLFALMQQRILSQANDAQPGHKVGLLWALMSRPPPSTGGSDGMLQLLTC